MDYVCTQNHITKLNPMGGLFYGQTVNVRTQSKIKSNGTPWLSNATRMYFV